MGLSEILVHFDTSQAAKQASFSLFTLFFSKCVTYVRTVGKTLASKVSLCSKRIRDLKIIETWKKNNTSVMLHLLHSRVTTSVGNRWTWGRHHGVHRGSKRLWEAFKSRLRWPRKKAFFYFTPIKGFTATKLMWPEHFLKVWFFIVKMWKKLWKMAKIEWKSEKLCKK